MYSLIGLHHVLKVFPCQHQGDGVKCDWLWCETAVCGLELLGNLSCCPRCRTGVGLWVLREWELFLVCQITLGADMLHCHWSSAWDKKPDEGLAGCTPPAGRPDKTRICCWQHQGDGLDFGQALTIPLSLDPARACPCGLRVYKTTRQEIAHPRSQSPIP